MQQVNKASNEGIDVSEGLHFCVIIPTYNNHKTLKKVVDAVLTYTQNVIIVNDGSTDGTATILKQFPQIEQIHFPKNKGKGMALRAGFEKAKAMGFTYAITIDSDGQHFAANLPDFFAYCNNHKNILLIGSRNMTQEGVPKKSSFGNAFSNFWFWFETGIRLQDTQSGYRLYPLKRLPTHFFTTKFEFEIEVIVRAAWNGCEVQNIPIQVLYDPTERVSHFRPFKDFTRISILNTVLVTIALFYIKPRTLFRKIKEKGLVTFFLKDVLKSDDSNSKKAISIALGVFIGIAPLWGFQTVLVFGLAALFKLNKAISFAFTNISFPPFIPFIIFLSLKVGGLLVPLQTELEFKSSLTFKEIGNHFTQYLVGSVILATLLAVLFGAVSYFLLSIFNKTSTKFTK